MTIDDQNSIYVGGLPYESSEESLRKVFDIYGKVVAVKIINDREVGGKCYGFVTFTNPRSAVNAIDEMNGKKIGGRIVRVNIVRSRGRSNFNRENFHRDFERDVDWDRDRDRGRDYYRGRDRYRDQYNDRPTDRDREQERDYDHDHDHERESERFMDRDRDMETEDHDRERMRDDDQDYERDHEMDWDRDREIDREDDHDRSRSRDVEKHSRNRHGGRSSDRHSREPSSNSSDGCDQIKEQVEISIQRREELEKEIVLIKEKSEEKQKLALDLQKKAQKLEDALATAKKLTSEKQSHFNQLQRCYLQIRVYTEKVESCQQELLSLVDKGIETDGDDDGNASPYPNGTA